MLPSWKVPEPAMRSQGGASVKTTWLSKLIFYQIQSNSICCSSTNVPPCLMWVFVSFTIFECKSEMCLICWLSNSPSPPGQDQFFPRKTNRDNLTLLRHNKILHVFSPLIVKNEYTSNTSIVDLYRYMVSGSHQLPYWTWLSLTSYLYKSTMTWRFLE